MPFRVDFDRKNRIIRSRFFGRVAEEDLKQFIRTGHVHVSCSQPAAAILDMSEATSFEVAAATIGALARVPPIIPDPNVHRIIIAPSTEIYGISRMFQIQAEPLHPNLHVVRTEREAWAILAVQKPRFKPLDGG